MAVLQTKSKFNGLKNNPHFVLSPDFVGEELDRARLDSRLVHAVLMEDIQSYLADVWASAGGPR